MRLIRCLPLLATLALAGCDGATLPPVAPSEGALRFDFAGDLAGSFEAVGAAEETPSTTHAWAYADLDATHWVNVTAYRPHADGNGGDRISFAFPLVDGARLFDWADCPADAACPGGAVFFQWGAHPMPESEGVYGYSSGLIRITSVSGTRIRGSFAGKAHAMSDGGPLTLSDGSFDLPLRHAGFELD
jgi:hypothetical protein